jgi:cytochrome d ubiquinol oxidase subunit II
MTIGAAIFFPLVLLYQGWSFHVFRARVTAPPDQAEAPPDQAQAAAIPAAPPPA